MNDRVIGLVLCTAATVAFAYYTVWALVTPFIDDDHPVLDWFPDRRYAVLLPAALGALLVACVCVFLGSVMAVHLRNHGPKSKFA
jgi:dolichyl-phosphate mannosyltransferase polypeptide 2 regulatory subunit